uniref:Pinopsin-like n=1 Tax=Callorhinchus milii TaxID=7868 RepID=A0A4W3K091_CALMI
MDLPTTSVGIENGTVGAFDGPQWPYFAPKSTYMAVATLMGTVVILASFVNGLVIVVSIKYKKLRSPLNYILVNLAIADLLVTFFGSTVSFSNNINGYFVLGETVCQFEGFMVSLTGIVGLWSLAILAFERYIVICKPMGDFRFQQKHAVWGCLFTWLWSLFWTLPPLFGWCSYSFTPWLFVGTLVSNERIMIIIDTPYHIPRLTHQSSAQGVSFVSVALQVAKQQKESETTQRAEREVTRMVVMMVGAFLVCWLPYTSFAMVVAINKDIVIHPTLASMPSYFSKTATVYNPVIYIFMNKQFRHCLLSLMCCGRNPFTGDEDTTSSSASGSRTEATTVSEGGNNKVVPA